METRHGGRGRAGKRAAVVGAEPLEGRRLLSGTIVDVTSLPPTVAVGPMTTARDGNLWYAEVGREGGPALARLSVSGARTEVPLPAADAGYSIAAVAADQAGAVWYTLYTGSDSQSPPGKVGRVGPDNAVSEYPLPSPQERPGSAVIGPDGSLWVATTGGPNGPALVRYAADGSPDEFAVSGAKDLTWLSAGTDGNVWFVDGARIGKMTPAGTATEYDLAAPSGGGAVDLSNAQLTAGPDGNLWFLGLGGVSKITPDGAVKTFDAPGTHITSLARGADGNLWFAFLPPAQGRFAGSPGSLITRFSTDGQTTVLTDPVDGALTPVPRMAGGSDASLWLDEGGGKIGRVNLIGVSSFSMPIVKPQGNVPLATDAAGKVSGRVAGFTPADASLAAGDFSASVDWGDGQTSAGTVAASAAGGYDVGGSHTYRAPAGSQETVTVTVSSPGGAAKIYTVVKVGGPTTPANAPATTPAAPAAAHATGKARPAPRPTRVRHPQAQSTPAVKAHPRGPAVHAARAGHPQPRRKH